MRCKDARAEGSRVPALGAKTADRRSAALRHARVPSIPLSRWMMDVSALLTHSKWAHPGATVLVGHLHEGLRQGRDGAPAAPPGPPRMADRPDLHEHPADQLLCLAIELHLRRRGGRLLPGCSTPPEGQTIGELQAASAHLGSRPPRSRDRLLPADGPRSAGFPTPIRRFLWAASLLRTSGLSPPAKRFGTFGVTPLLGGRGVEQIHPLCPPLTTTLTFGPIDDWGKVTVKIIYDHRVLDGAYVARRLVDLEETLNTVILDELRRGEACEVLPLSTSSSPTHAPRETAPRPSTATNAGRGA